MSRNVDQKVETVPVVVEQENLPAPAMVPLAKVSGMMAAVDQVVKDVMKENTDYGTIPGTKKPTLFKPGAEKLNAVFGLSAHFELLDSVEDHFREWEYDRIIKSEWDDKLKRKVPVDVEKGCKARGYYYYRYRCTLTSRGGLFASDSEGSFSSMEPGRETAPANTIQKMAQKRALVAATLLATFSSDRFTQDLEDMPEGSAGGSSKPTSDLPGVEHEMASKKEDGYCWFCDQKRHIKAGDIIVKAKIPGKDDAVWGAKECYVKNILQVEEEQTAGDNIIATIQEHEERVFGSDAKAASKMEAARTENAGKVDLGKCTEAGLNNYLEYLQKQ